MVENQNIRQHLKLNIVSDFLVNVGVYLVGSACHPSSSIFKSKKFLLSVHFILRHAGHYSTLTCLGWNGDAVISTQPAR